jgi:integrase
MSERPRSKPIHVARAGSVKVPVYAYAAREGAAKRYCVAWRKAGQLKRETFTVRKDALDRAEEMALAIANGQAEVLSLSNADRDSYLIARRLLDRLGFAAPSLHDAVEQFVRAKETLGDHTLGEAVDYFVRGRKSAPPAKLSGSEVLARLLASIEDTPARTPGEYRYRNGLKKDLTRFVAAHPRIETLRAQDIREYLRGLGVGPRRRDNVRDEIMRLFRFAKTKDGGEVFAPNEITEGELVKRLNEPTAITTYSADELILQLKFTSDRWQPWLVIAAFAGLRPSEILRLDWSAFKWDEQPEPAIAVPANVARKTNSPRRAELNETLRYWLAPMRGAVGPLYGACDLKSEHRLLKELGRETKRVSALISAAIGCEWKWKNDAHRHSYGSYRYAQVKDFALLASWMGNSVPVVRKRYYDSKSEQDGNAWFAVRREHAANVIQGNFDFAEPTPNESRAELLA